MSITLTTKGKQNILVADNPLSDGVGGEGSVHKIISPSWYQGYCVKIYFNKFRSRKRERKLDFMLQQSLPGINNLQNGGCVIGWPKELVYQNNRCVGFVMPLAFSGSYQVYELCTPNIRKLPPLWQSRFDRATPKGIESRLKLCVNIASAINQIHSTGKYVLVDLKPQNILATNDGKVSIIDLDSIQIAENNQVIFPAQVATPEYVPVEGNHINPARDLIPASWDRFSLAVLFYELLFGLHPYAASFQGQYQNSNSVPDSIKYGLFVFGSKKKYVHVRPPLHDNFTRIPTSLQNLFIRAFDSGHSNPGVRPTAEEWGKTIYQELRGSSYQLKGFSKTIRVKPAVKTIPASASYEGTQQNHPLAAQATTTTKTTPAKTAKKSLPVGKIVGWSMALIFLFFILPGIFGSFIRLVKSFGSRSSPYSSNPATYMKLCQNGNTGYLTTNVKLRRDPTTNNKQLSIHYKGARVQILEVRQGEYSRGNNYWYRIRVLQKGCHAEHPSMCGSEGSVLEGWVHSQLITCN